MSTLKVPTPLRTYTAGQSEVIVQGATVGEALNDLLSQFPALRPHLMNEEGHLRAFVNLFLGEENTRDLQGLSTPLATDSKLRIIPSIAGGVSPTCCRCEEGGSPTRQSPHWRRILTAEIAPSSRRLLRAECAIARKFEIGAILNMIVVPGA